MLESLLVEGNRKLLVQKKMALVFGGQKETEELSSAIKTSAIFLTISKKLVWEFGKRTGKRQSSQIHRGPIRRRWEPRWHIQSELRCLRRLYFKDNLSSCSIFLLHCISWTDIVGHCSESCNDGVTSLKFADENFLKVTRKITSINPVLVRSTKKTLLIY